MKKDVKQLLKRFTQKGIKNGDLVLVGEICRVVDVDWGKRDGGERDDILVYNEIPVCESCKSHGKRSCGHSHVVKVSTFGQQSVMKLVG